MPPAGTNKKRKREYEKLKREFEQTGRYPGREEEVAARIVNKQRRQYGETRAERARDRAGTSPDRGLPIADYQRLTIPEVKAHLDDLGDREVRQLRKYEERHKNRKGLLQAIDRRLEAA